MPARIQIHHGNHSVGEITLPPVSRWSETPRTIPSIVCFTGFGMKIQYGTLNELPVEKHLGVAHALRVRLLPEQRARDHTAVSSTPTAPTATASGHVRRGERTSHSSTAATPTKIATTTCDITAAAISTAGSHRRFPVSRVYASAPSANSASAERDLERVLARERARDVAAVDVPVGALLHEHPERGDRERGRRRATARASPCANA